MRNLRNQLSHLSDRAVLFVLLMVALISSLLSAMVNGQFSVETFPVWIENWLQNFSTEMFGAFITFLLLQIIVGTRQEKERLLRDLGSSVNQVTKRAAEELRARGWHRDGTLRGTYWRNANLQEADLRGADLEGADLIQANLQEIVLLSANLRHAQLVFAYLYGAGLVRADLRDANLVNANLQDAHLSQADLRGAELVYADLRGAELMNANMIGATVNGARFDENTTLPDGMCWTPNTIMERFTDPQHPAFWERNHDTMTHRPVMLQTAG